MKQKSLLKTLLLLCALVVGSVSSWAQGTTGVINFGNNGTKVNAASVTGSDSNGNTWTVTTDGTSSFTQSTNYSQIGSSGSPATSITFTTSFEDDETITGFEAKFGGFNKTAGTVTLKVGDTTVGTGSLNGTNDVIVRNTTSSTGKVLTVTVTGISKGVKVYYISYTYNANQVAQPTFNPNGGTFTTAQNVEISCATTGATIRYTTNGDDPTENDAVYSSAITVTTSGTVVKAKAFMNGKDPSVVATSEPFIIKPAQPYISSVGSTVTIAGISNGCECYYTTDGTEPSKTTSTKYTSPFQLTADCTIKAIVYDQYNNSSDVLEYAFAYFPLNPKNINSGYYVKVTNASDLEDGDAILIVNEQAGVAMSTNQKDNNRGQKEVTISNNVIYVQSADVQKLVLAKQTANIDGNTDVFYFYTGAGYLYAAASNKNYLRTETVPDNDNNARATIDISDENGNAIIKFTGTYTRNTMQYNSNSSLFSCYGYEPESDASALQIYKEVAHDVTAKVTSAEYATFHSDYAVDFSESGITVYTATEGETSVRLTEITSGQVPLGTPVVLHKAGGATADIPVIAFDMAAPVEGTNDLRVVGEGGLTDAENIFVLAMPSGKPVGFYLWDSNATLNEGKVYLQGTPNTRTYLPFNEVTGISENVSVKNDSNAIYDLQGRRVVKAQKGLYIVNGKKVIMK